MQSCLFIRANRASIVPSVMSENTGGQIERVQRRGGSEKRGSGRGGGGGVDNGRPVCDHGRMRRGEEEDAMAMMIGVGCGERGTENEGGRGYWYFLRIVTWDKGTVHMMMNICT